jgi:hypothetical protein
MSRWSFFCASQRERRSLFVLLKISPRARTRVQSALASVRVDTSALPRSHFEGFCFLLSLVCCVLPSSRLSSGVFRKGKQVKKPSKITSFSCYYSSLTAELLLSFSVRVCETVKQKGGDNSQKLFCVYRAGVTLSFSLETTSECVELFANF